MNENRWKITENTMRDQWNIDERWIEIDKRWMNDILPVRDQRMEAFLIGHHG